MAHLNYTLMMFNTALVAFVDLDLDPGVPVMSCLTPVGVLCPPLARHDGGTCMVHRVAQGWIYWKSSNMILRMEK